MSVPVVKTGVAKRNKRFRLRKWIGIMVLAFILVLWEVLPDQGVISPLVIASPSSMWQAAQADGGQFMAAFWVTVMEMVWTVGITWMVGLVVGLLLGSVPVLRESFTPLLDAAFAIPWVVLYPLVVSWFGLDSPSKIAYGVILGILPVILNTMSGMKSIDSRYLLLARSLSASRWDTLVKIAVPLALPSIVSGLRIGAGLSIIGVIVGEMFTSTRGIGYLISYYRTLLDTGHVFLGMLLALTVACLSNLGLSYLEKKFKRYAHG